MSLRFEGGGHGATMGQLYGGRYQTSTLLKSGQGISAWLGRDTVSGAAVVIKLTAAHTVPEAMRHRLEHEARVLRTLRGSRNVSTLASGTAGEQFFLVLPYIEGQSLEARLRRGPLSVIDTVRLGLWLMESLAEVHELGIVHRDVKPANIIVNDGDRLTRAKLIDFGFARSARVDAGLPDEAVGTVLYVSPEQAGLLDADVDRRADYYSLAVVLWECVAGVPPFQGRALSEVLRQHVTARPPPLSAAVPGVPHALEAVLLRLLAKDPADRYQSAEGVVADLSALLQALERGESQPALVPGGADRRPSLTEPAFVGRTRELRTLLGEVERARQGQGRLIRVAAESGGGKTRLLDELASRVGEAMVLRGQGLAAAGARPFQMLVGVAEDLLARAHREPEFAAALRDRLSDHAPAIAAALPELSEALQLAEPARGTAQGPEAFGEARTLAALSALLDAIGPAAGAALVLLDDAQWADDSTLKLLRFWQDRRRPAAGADKVAVVAAFRSEEVADDHPLRRIEGCFDLVVARLDRDEVARLAESMAGSLPVEVVNVLEALSGGSPFMAGAVLRGMVEGGALVHETTGWRADPVALDNVRSSRRAAVFLAHRLERLPAPALALLSVGAVLGKDFPVDLAARLAEQDHATAAAAVDEGRRRHIVWSRGHGARVVFVHDKLRETLLARIPQDERRQLHARAAAALVDEAPDTVFEIAYHFDAAGEPTRALPFALQAAERARARHALAVAEEHYRIAARGVECDPSAAVAGTPLRVVEGLADVLILRGDYEQAALALDRAESLAETSFERARLDGKRGDLAFKRGDMERSIAALEGGLRALGRWVPRRRVTVLLACLWEIAVQAMHTWMPRWWVGRRPVESAERELLAIRIHSRLAHAYWFARGRIACGWTHLRGLNQAERYRPTAELAQAYSEHAPVATMIPAFARGLRYAERSLEIRRSLGDLWGEGQSLHFMGVVLYGASRFDECIDRCREAMRLLDRTGDRWEYNTAGWHEALALYRRGRLAEAREAARRVHRDGLALGDAQAVGISLGAWAKAAEGEVPEALTKAALTTSSSDVHTRAEIAQAEALRLLRAGRAPDAVEVLERTDALIVERGLRQEYVAPVLPWLLTALRLQIESTPAHAPSERQRLLRKAAPLTKRALRLARAYQNNQPHALREAGLLASLGGDTTRAERYFAQSLAAAEGQGAEHERLLTLEARARVGAALGWARAEADAKEAATMRARQREAEGQEKTISEAPAETWSLVERFTQVIEHGRKIAAALSREAVVDATCAAATSLLRAERSQIVPLDAGGQLSRAALSTVTSYAPALVVSLVERALAAKGPLVIGEGVNGELTESLILARLRSVIAAPIYVHGRAVACLLVTHSRLGRLFGALEERLADYIVTLSGAAWENAEGFSRVTEAVRVRDEFLAIASHELKTPLTPLQVQIDRLRLAVSRRGAFPDDMGPRLESMARQTTRLTNLVDRLLDASRIAAGRMQLELAEVDLAALVREVVRRAHHESVQAKSPLTLEAPASLHGQWDALRLDQVLTNLVSNAVKYGQGSPVTVRLRDEGESAVVDVQDAGIGIRADDAERVFERFERAVPAQNYGGLGLGLYIARQIVRAHHGDISLRSEPERGALFSVRLPKRPWSEPQPSPAGESAAASPGEHHVRAVS